MHRPRLENPGVTSADFSKATYARKQHLRDMGANTHAGSSTRCTCCVLTQGTYDRRETPLHTTTIIVVIVNDQLASPTIGTKNVGFLKPTCRRHTKRTYCASMKKNAGKREGRGLYDTTNNQHSGAPGRCCGARKMLAIETKKTRA